MANVFAKRQIDITKGKAATLWDIEGKEYIDCMGSYGVAVLGHCHPKVVAAIKEQAEKPFSPHQIESRAGITKAAGHPLRGSLCDPVSSGLSRLYDAIFCRPFLAPSE